MNAFESCEFLIRKHAPLMMLVGDFHEPKECWRIRPVYRPPASPACIARIKELRSKGTTIGEIARKVNLTWRTTWRYCQL